MLLKTLGTARFQQLRHQQQQRYQNGMNTGHDVNSGTSVSSVVGQGSFVTKTPASLGVPDDRRLSDQIHQALAATGHSQLQRIDVLVNEGLVVLRGRVLSYYQKQIATAAVLAIGVEDFRNELEVVRNDRVAFRCVPEA